MVTTTSEEGKVLAEAATYFLGESTQRPEPETVVSALLQAEKRAKQKRIEFSYSNLIGRWRLCFATRTRKAKQGGITLGKGYYFPKITPASISFLQGAQENRGEIENQVQLGGLKLKFSGLTQYLSKKNLLAFDFTQIELSVFDRVIYGGEVRGGKKKEQSFYECGVGKLPFFAFFVVSDRFIAARGRGGGLALWVKES